MFCIFLDFNANPWDQFVQDGYIQNSDIAPPNVSRATNVGTAFWSFWVWAEFLATRLFGKLTFCRLAISPCISVFHYKVAFDNVQSLHIEHLRPKRHHDNILCTQYTSTHTHKHTQNVSRLSDTFKNAPKVKKCQFEGFFS